MILSKSTHRTGKGNRTAADRLAGGQENSNSLADVDERLADLSLAFQDGMFLADNSMNDDGEDDDDANTKFVLQVLVESRECLKKLVGILLNF